MSREFTEIYERNVDSVYRICFMYMKNKADTEDMTQNVFLKLVVHLRKAADNYDEPFESREHETAWLIRVAGNLCKNSLKSLWNRRVALEDWDCDMYSSIPEPDETLAKLLKLSANLKTAMYLHYYEDRTTAEIAAIMQKPESTVRGYLHRGRKALKAEILLEEKNYA